MRIIRGDYPGASEFAYFDRDLVSMSADELRGLLECILHRASPGDPNAALVYRELGIAEQCFKEGAVEERIKRAGAAWGKPAL